jgi:hypothetical protein
MPEPRAHTPDDSDATLVTPRFDEEETVLAQPVVPLDAPEELPPHTPAAAPRPYAARRQWPLALVLVSALVGSVIGGAGLYFFQKHRRSNVAPAAPAEAAQPSPAPTVEQAAEAADEVSAPAPESAPAAEIIDADEAAAAPDERADKRADDDDRDAERADKTPAPAPTRAREGSPKRGKKGERDDESQRRERRSASEGEEGRSEARRVDVMTYPSRRDERRAERRARRAARSVDRVRAIFEGQPE